MMNKIILLGVTAYLMGVVLLLGSFQYGTLLPGVIVTLVGVLVINRGLSIRRSRRR